MERVYDVSPNKIYRRVDWKPLHSHYPIELCVYVCECVCGFVRSNEGMNEATSLGHSVISAQRVPS